ncbi:MAG: ATP-dependent DNA helicase RecG, partial [Clostridia bacterium]|nr:ATP-dependent DNA helicase RecG [Clostridia bacterium]
MLLERDIKYIKGVGDKRAALFSKLEIKTLYDLLSFFPRGYEDRTTIVKIKDATLDENQAVVATITSNIRISKTKSRQDLIKFTISDETASMPVIFFNNKYIAEKLQKGETYLFYGKISGDLTSFKMTNPAVEPIISKTPKGEILPIYSLTKGLSQDIMRKVIKGSIIAIQEFSETLPPPIINKFDLISKEQAYLNIHFPKDLEFLDKARKRLAFEELLTLQLGMFMLKNREKKKTAHKINFTELDKFYSSLPYKPTNAQIRCINEAIADMGRDYSMNRLIQGDVGSGKTLVAAALCYIISKNNLQSALMVPTEILAKQHYDYFCETLSPFGIKVDLLTSSTTKKEKDLIKSRLENGETDLVVGTHSLISDDIKFKNLSLVITDEQHRFGVWQRASLADKSENPHVLVMSATPIPRTLALIMYGDLDISVIDELPPGRQKVDTYFVDSKYQNRIYNFIKNHISNNNQVYIVCPLVDENENEDLKAATTYAENLQKIFPDYNVGLIHGKLKSAEKDKIMNSFAENKTQILVST